ncbi:MAG: Methionine aminopeptidase [Parcubacteria group bacterium GW2011_GWA2_49_9]|nr:MAG: Methionine aminopeptidase [Parcubacteria group bacterium GW2011_GWA2_49_9]
MPISIKTKQEIAILREGGKRLAEILRAVAAEVKAGVSTHALNDLAEKLITERGDTPSFLGYSPSGAKRPFPAALCVSVNDEVVHGIPNETEKFLKEGDIVTLDAGLIHQGLFTDSAITVGVGKINEKAQKLIDVTKKSLSVGIKAVRAGATTGDIGYAIEKFVKPFGYGIVRELAGHGVGYAVHEEPFVPNFGKRGEGVVLKAGMVLAIEPMLNEGGAVVKLASDGYTYRTRDGSRSAHFEHTVVVTENGSDILTAS